MEFIKVAERQGKYSTPIQDSQCIVKYMQSVGAMDREAVWTLHLDNRLRIIDMELVALGTLSGAVVTPREILKKAILKDSKAIILVHNHPSGDPSPSQDDIKLTKLVKKACKLFNIDLLDHIIITPSDKFYSMANNKIL